MWCHCIRAEMATSFIQHAIHNYGYHQWRPSCIGLSTCRIAFFQLFLPICWHQTKWDHFRTLWYNIYWDQRTEPSMLLLPSGIISPQNSKYLQWTIFRKLLKMYLLSQIFSKTEDSWALIECFIVLGSAFWMLMIHFLSFLFLTGYWMSRGRTKSSRVYKI